MNRPPQPDRETVVSTALIRYHLAGHIASLLYGGDAKACDGVLREIVLMEANVRKNRPVDTPISWDDLKAFAVGTIRILLKHLEGT